jgi:CubicO group peptidase (beta-lactamase class C family)
MNRRKRAFLYVATVWAAVNCCVAAERGNQKSAAEKPLAAAIDTAIQEQIKKYNIPGLTIAVTDGNRIVYSRAYGWADLENGVRVTPETLFRIGSITKPITATAAFIFAERDKLDLDAPVQLYCSSFPEKPEPVTTTRELLAHLGGVRGFRTDDPDFPEIFNATHYERLYKSIALFARDPLVARPGTRYEYSHYGYELVGCVLEGAALHDFEYVLHVGIFGEGGMVGPMLDFKDVLSGVVFMPAGMNSTRLDDVTEIITNRSRSYTHAKDKTIRNARYLDTSNRMAAAGLLSTANDLARFAIALESGKLLPTSAVRDMWREQQTEDGEHAGYGLGWMIRDHNGTLVAAHTGELPGASSILYIMPDKHISFVVLANTDAAGLWPLANQLADLLTGVSER